jgi:hypothetical protein
MHHNTDGEGPRRLRSTLRRHSEFEQQDLFYPETHEGCSAVLLLIPSDEGSEVSY